MPATYEDVEQAIRGVAGVASASVAAAPDGSARERLRIRLAPGHDPDVVAAEVARMLSTRFGVDIDPAAIRPLPASDPAPGPAREPAPAAPAQDARSGPTPDGLRPRIQGLHVDDDELAIRVEAVLGWRGRDLHGRATAAATPDAALRAVARATLDAVDQLAPGRLKTELELVELSPEREEALVTVAVTLLTRDRAEKLVGVSLVRDDARRAVMRATLDAVNRRIGALVEAPAD